MGPLIYLDYQASTPCDPRVVEAMRPYFMAIAGNPHNRQHRAGRAAAEAIEKARAEIAHLIGARPAEIIFTSGATEANNIALAGVGAAIAAKGGHIISVVSEHASVLAPLAALARAGAKVTLLPVDRFGLIDPDEVARAFRPETALISVMLANNEIGTIQPLDQIGRLCRARGVLLHSDAVQAAGRMALDVKALGIDLLSLSAHKIYGPKGIGALYVREAVASRVAPLLHGGGQERGWRPGTLPTPLCVGFGHAAALVAAERASDQARMEALTALLWQGLRARLPNLRRNGAPDRSVAGCLNLTFAGLDAGALLDELPDLALSSGAACHADSGQPSAVLAAIGLDEQAAQGTLRISLGRFTREAEILAATAMIGDAAHRLVSSLPSG